MDNHQQEELWSSILDSVSSSRSIPSKQILMLGLPGSGKSTLTNALLKKEANQDDFALGYDFADVRDDADEDTLARLSVYSIPNESPAYTSLIPDFLNPRTCLPNTLVTIVLDWTRPWTFVEQLEIWLKWIETWSKGDGSRETDIAREESRERLQAHIQRYSEPSSDPLPTSSSALDSTLLPLGPGTLTDNTAGVPILVVCAKADLIDEQPNRQGGASGMTGMVKGKGGEWEERNDAIMQVLRTICLKYGAGLCYTTQNPETLSILRQYALHLLFLPPAPSPAAAAGNEPVAPVRNPFPFNHKPNALDRDRVLIPIGWDSWGKIGVLRDGFDARAWGEGLEEDLSEEPEADVDGAKRMYEGLVQDQGVKPPPLPAFNSPTPEQSFLAKHYDENSKTKDPRGVFRNPAEMTAAGGLVGPMESQSINMPNVEQALANMGTGITSLTNPAASDAARRIAARSNVTGSGTSRPTPLNNGLATSPTARGVTSPGIPSSPVAPGQSQNEVLQNFFDSLLKTKDRKPVTGLRASTSSQQTNGSNEDS
ncbi:dynein light intermediate chain-domain-containing protein [Flagelloscypha sp. PMI_526]|nr:dynein light intermediate chain-domain-containing protein [Flagelloscypha sp. PMI_526]